MLSISLSNGLHDAVKELKKLTPVNLHSFTETLALSPVEKKALFVEFNAKKVKAVQAAALDYWM